ncbi:hypothetical protein [Nitrospira sp. Nam74]
MSVFGCFDLRLILVVFMATVLAACSTKHIPISPEHVKALPSRTVSVVHYNPEPFMVWRGEQKARSVALGFFALIGGVIEGGMQLADAKEEGAKFISQTQLTDPLPKCRRVS